MSEKSFITVKISELLPIISKEYVRINDIVTANKKKYLEIYAKEMDKKLKSSWFKRFFFNGKIDQVQHTIEQAFNEVSMMYNPPYLKDENGDELIWWKSEQYLKEVEFMKKILSDASKHNLQGTISVPFSSSLSNMLAANGVSDV